MPRNRKPAKLQNLFFITFLLVSGLILLVFALFFYRYVSGILIEQETAALINLTDSFQAQTDDVVNDMDSMSINVDYSRAIDNLLGSNRLNLSQVSITAFADLCTTINGVEQKVDQTNVFDFDGNILQVGILTKHATYQKASLPWLDEIRKTGGSKILSVPYHTDRLARSGTGSEWYLSLYRCCYDAYGNQVGAIETVKKCKSVFKSIVSHANRNDNAPAVYVYNRDGSLMYPYDLSADEIRYDYCAIPEDAENGILYTNPQTHENEIIAYAVSSFTGWTYVTVQAESTVLAPARAMLKLLAAITGVMLLGCVLISYGMSRRLIMPINRFKEEIRRTGLATLDRPADAALTHSYSELAELNDSFQKMRLDLKASMDELLETRKQETRSRNLALQSQINPHFYYTSLASVIALAENNQRDEVIQMCLNLTRIMRYITNSEELVTVDEEIDYVGKYLYCMKVRYQTSLNYMIDIDERIREEKIPRLIIQPIVENAIKYGIDSEPPWGIAVHGYIADDYWAIDVMDSGKGFSAEVLDTIWKRISEAEKQIGMPQTQISGMGTLNVYLRWKLYCGDDMIFELKNTEKGHGIVTLGRKYNAKDKTGGDLRDQNIAR